MRLLVVLWLVMLTGSLSAQKPPAPIERRTTALHPMRYLVSRPLGWKAGESYPVVVAVTDGDREFEKTARAFMAARGNRPWVIVVPEVLTGGPPLRYSPSKRAAYDYGTSVWFRAYMTTDCAFDVAGMTALVLDVKRLDSPLGRFYLTGWEAGGHLVWAQYFRHPETWSAVAAVSPNYISRCMQDRKFATPVDSGPPVRLFYSASDTAGAPGGVLYTQWLAVQRIATRQGFAHLSEKSVAARPRGPMPQEVLAWFDSLRAAGSGRH